MYCHVSHSDEDEDDDDDDDGDDDDNDSSIDDSGDDNNHNADDDCNDDNGIDNACLAGDKVRESCRSCGEAVSEIAHSNDTLRRDGSVGGFDATAIK
jgi:hypothetical protein